MLKNQFTAATMLRVAETSICDDDGDDDETGRLIIK